jgi:hypothetical protein
MLVSFENLLCTSSMQFGKQDLWFIYGQVGLGLMTIDKWVVFTYPFKSIFSPFFPVWLHT